MNIFVTSECPKQSAVALDNRRLNKMMLETVQLFGFAMHNMQIDKNYHPRKKDGTIYNSSGSHRKHPCTLWLQKSRGNFDWLLNHLKSMCEEYEYRYGRQSSYEENIKIIESARDLWPKGDITEFADCSIHKSGDTILSYRYTMTKKWEDAKSQKDPRKSVSFGNRGEPEWYKQIAATEAWKI